MSSSVTITEVVTDSDDNLSDTEVKYLSTNRVATHFTGEDLCDLAAISGSKKRRNAGSAAEPPTVELKDYNNGYIDAMINRDHKRGTNLANDTTDYEIESMVNSMVDFKPELLVTYSSDERSDGDETDGTEPSDLEDRKDWTPNVFLPPREDLNTFDTIYKIDFNESLDTCVNYSPDRSFKAPKGYDSYQKAFGFDKWFINRLKQLRCQEVRLELHLWPSIFKGHSISCTSSPKSGKTSTYLIPLMYWFDNPAHCGDERSGIGAVIICSSTRQTYETARLAKQWRDPEAVNQTVRIIAMNSSNADKLYSTVVNGCDLLISTPSALLDAMEKQVIDFSETKYFIIDDADICLNVHKQAIRDIYVAFARSKPSIAIRGDNLMAFQTMIFAEKWTPDVRGFTKEIQHLPLITFGSYYELSIVLNIECHLEVIEEELRNDTIVKLIQKARQLRKTCIAVVCRTSAEVSYLRVNLGLKLNKKSIIAVTHETNHYDLEKLAQRWTGNTVLLINDSAIKNIMGFTRSQCIIHYKLPQQFYETFGNRFRLMRHYIKSYNRNHSMDKFFEFENIFKLSNYIVVSPEEKQVMPNLIRYLKRLKMKIPKQLIDEQDSKSLPICRYYSLLGKCPFQSLDCLNVHSLGDTTRSVPQLPTNGQMKITVHYVLGANDFYFRISAFRSEQQTSGKWQSMDVTYDQISEELNALRDMPYNTVDIVSDQHLYGISIRGQVFRVRLTQVLGVEDINFSEDYDPNNKNQKVELYCIDFGHKLRSNSRQLFELPANLRDYPPLAYRGRLFGIKPIGNEIEWDFRATQKFYEFVDNYRVIEMTAWILRQIDGRFWLNRLSVNRKLKNTNVMLNDDVSNYLIKLQLVESTDQTLANVNKDYNKIVNIWSNNRLNTLAFNSYLVEPFTKVVVSDWVNVNEFYVTYENRVQRLQHFEDKWTASLELLTLLPEVIEQQICFYKHYDCVNNETALNRAKVIAINGDYVDVFLVDHGETMTKVLKSTLYAIQDIHIKEFSFQAIKVCLFGVKEVKPITYDLICELTRNKCDQYFMAIANKMDESIDSNIIRLFVANDERETQFTALSKLLVDLNYCQYIDGEEDNELETEINKDIEELDDDFESDYLESIERQCEDNLVKDFCLQMMELNEDEDIDHQSISQSNKGLSNESRVSRKLRQLRQLKRNQDNDQSDDDSDDGRVNHWNGNWDDIDFSNYEPSSKTYESIAYYDPQDDDRESLHSDEDDLIEEEELS